MKQVRKGKKEKYKIRDRVKGGEVGKWRDKRRGELPQAHTRQKNK